MRKSIIVIGLLLMHWAYGIEYEIVTGSKTGTYFQIGRDLARYVAPDAGIRLRVLNSNGSLDNVLKLRSARYPRVKFAIVQNDVLQEIGNRAIGNPMFRDLYEKLRVIAPLYNEEIHIIARADANIQHFSDLRDKRIGVGKRRSGTAMTSLLLYQELFGSPMSRNNMKLGSFDDALRDLQAGRVDAIVKVAGQPVTRLSKDMGSGASKYIKLLSYTRTGQSSYYRATIKASSYLWLDHDVPTLSTKAYLITFDYHNPTERRYIKAFVRSLRRHLPAMQRQASSASFTPHPKWKQVDDMCGASLPGGWKFYSVVNEICGRGGGWYLPRHCTDIERQLGLCR